MPFHDLPDELLLHIANYIPELKHLNALAQTNYRSYHALNLTLYRLSIQKYKDVFTLSQCAYEQKLHHIQLLLGMNPSPADKDKALYTATVGKHYSTMKLLIKHGANANAKMANGLTALHAAVSVARPIKDDVIGTQILIKNNANLEEKTGGYHIQGYNALHLACGFRSKEIIKLLLDSGMDIECKTAPRYYRPKTPLTCAIIGFDFDFKTFFRVIYAPIKNLPRHILFPWFGMYPMSIAVSVLLQHEAEIDGVPDAARKDLEGWAVRNQISLCGKRNKKCRSKQSF